MYNIKPIVDNSNHDIAHTDAMYKCDSHLNSSQSSCTSAATTELRNGLDTFSVTKSIARSKLGRALQDKKQTKEQKNKNSTNEPEINSFNTTLRNPTNEMHLDRYIIRKTAPASKLGRHLQSQGKKNASGTEDFQLRSRLEELDKQLDAILDPMCPTMTKKSVNKETSFERTSTAQPTGRLIKIEGTITPAFSKIGDSVLSASVTSIDLAIHCDPSSPPFAVLLCCKLLQVTGRTVSLQFYRHSSLESTPKHLPEVERYFTGLPRSPASEIILSIIWRPCPFGCVAISAPFTELPIYGESIILMFLSRLAPQFSKSLELLSQIDAAILCGNEKKQNECIKKVTATPKAVHSIPEISLFVSCVQRGLVPVLQKTTKAWVDKCMDNEPFVATKKLIELCL